MASHIDRRQFLQAAAGFGAAAALERVAAALGRTTQPPQASGPAIPAHRKLLVILFGGGTRSSESIDDPEHRYIPRLCNDMVPKGTLFTNMRVEHKVVHPNSAGSIMTGHWEWDDIDWTRPVAHPTIFEIYRKARRTPDTGTWAFVYASILTKTAESLAPSYGQAYAANVVEPPTIPRATAEQMDRRMWLAASLGSAEAEVEASAACAALARQTSRISTAGLRSQEARRFLNAEYAKWKAGPVRNSTTPNMIQIPLEVPMGQKTRISNGAASVTTSHDAFLTDRAIACMRAFAPDVMAIDFGEIDCAHYGSWSRYVDAIRRTDELTWRLWRATDQLDEYRGRTLLLILPDHGRELDRPGHWGFIHHSNFYTNEGADEGCRRVWMLALGPGLKAGRRVDRPVPITAVAATGLEFLGIDPSAGAERSVWQLIT